MNFVDAAIVVLEEAAEPLLVDELCERVLERELLSKPGANPLRSMKGRLTMELNKGEESRLVQTEDDRWGLADGNLDASSDSDEDVEEARADSELDLDLDDDEDDEDEYAEPLPPPTAEEEALLAIYGDDLSDAPSVSERTEYHDEKSDDEDRAMLPEIKPERKRWNNATRGGKGKRERRGKRGRGERSGSSEKTSSLRPLLGMDASYKIKEKSVRNAEEGLARAVGELETKTLRALSDRLGSLSLDGLEHLYGQFLERSDFSKLEWIKRVKSISYGVAHQSRGQKKYLIGVWSGDSPVTRRGVGELRAGVEAKGASLGLLLSARPLGADAEEELENDGARIEVLAGPSFVRQLVHMGIGVVRTAVPVMLLDVAEFREMKSS